MSSAAESRRRGGHLSPRAAHNGCAEPSRASAGRPAPQQHCAPKQQEPSICRASWRTRSPDAFQPRPRRLAAQQRAVHSPRQPTRRSTPLRAGKRGGCKIGERILSETHWTQSRAARPVGGLVEAAKIEKEPRDGKSAFVSPLWHNGGAHRRHALVGRRREINERRALAGRRKSGLESRLM